MTAENPSTDPVVDKRPDTSGMPSVPLRARRGLLVRLSVISVPGLLLLVVGLPTIAAMMGLHNVVLDRVTAGRELSAFAESATLGWFAPVTLREVDVKRDDLSWAVGAQSFSTEKTLLQLLMGLDDVGTVHLDRPRVVLQSAAVPLSDVAADDAHRKAKAAYPPLRAVVRDGAVEIRLPDQASPVIAIDGISFVSRTETVSDTSLLIVEPVRLFDHRKMTPELCDQGLQLIAPVLSEAAVVTGELTVELDEFQIPISTATPEERVQLTRISGRMLLHNVETGLRNPLLAEIASALAALSGRRFTTVRASEETQVAFQVENGRVYHEGLTLLIPELSNDLTISTSGWVDLQENIDVRILVNLSGLVPSRIEVFSSLTQTPLELHLTGTLKRPRIRFPSGRSLFDELAGRLGEVTEGSGTANGQPNLTGALSDLVGGLIGDKDKQPDAKRTTRGIFDLIQSLRKEPGSENPRK
jgi:hypothetical protein